MKDLKKSSMKDLKKLTEEELRIAIDKLHSDMREFVNEYVSGNITDETKMHGTNKTLGKLYSLYIKKLKK
jgi:hypothetical protein